MLAWLVGCHLFSSGTIEKTCEKSEAGCPGGDSAGDDSGIVGQAERILVALACSRCEGVDTLDGRYLADVWLLPDPVGAFPELAQKEPWDGPVTFDPASLQAYVAMGSTLIVLGPESGQVQPYDLVEEDILDMVAVGGVLFFTTGSTYYRWFPDLGKGGLTEAAGLGTGHLFQHLFLGVDEAGSKVLWAVDVQDGVDLWQIDIEYATPTLYQDDLWSEPGWVSGGLFSGHDGKVSSCNNAGEIFVFDLAAPGTQPISLGGPPSADVVGCGYDPGLGGHVVFEADQGVLFQADGHAGFSTLATPPNGGRVLRGRVAIP